MPSTLFISDVDTLKGQLRLSGANQSDALAQIDSAIAEVRLGFYDALGAARVAAIVALVGSSEPATADEILRSRAELCEGAWVRMLLLGRMPTLFVDSGAVVQQTWNEEGLGRSSSSTGSEKEISRLKSQIDDWLSDLAGETPDTSSINCSVIGPDILQPRPGSSINPINSIGGVRG